MHPILIAENITRRFGSGDTEVVAVKNISLTVSSGEVILIMGPSGSGTFGHPAVYLRRAIFWKRADSDWSR